MIRLFFRNIFRSILASVAVYAISAIITLILSVVGELVFNDLLGLFEVLTLPVCMIMISVLSLFVAWFIIASMMGGTSYICFDYDQFRSGKAKPHIAHLFFHMLLLFILLGGGTALFGWLKWDWVFSLITKNEWYLLLAVAFPSVCVTQFMYFVMGYRFYNREKCTKCKHCFCITEKSTGSTEWDTYGYTDTTRNESIATIESGSSKIDVRADVTRREYTKTHYTDTNIVGHCTRCGNAFAYTRHLHYKRKL